MGNSCLGGVFPPQPQAEKNVVKKWVSSYFPERTCLLQPLNRLNNMWKQSLSHHTRKLPWISAISFSSMGGSTWEKYLCYFTLLLPLSSLSIIPPVFFHCFYYFPFLIYSLLTRSAALYLLIEGTRAKQVDKLGYNSWLSLPLPSYFLGNYSFWAWIASVKMDTHNNCLIRYLEDVADCLKIWSTMSPTSDMHAGALIKKWSLFAPLLKSGLAL